MSFWRLLLARVRAGRLVKVLRERMAAGVGAVVVDGDGDVVWLASRVRMQRWRARWMRL
jgi:hypothetical protein